MNVYDTRVQYTRKVIENSFLKLLKEKPVSRITVTELCSDAGINRATFYKHYPDIQALLETMEDQVLDLLKTLWDEKAKGDFQKMILQVLRYTQEYGDRYFALASENGDPDFFAKMFLQSYQNAYPILENRVKGLPQDKLETVYRFLSHGCGGILTAWYRSGMNSPPEELSQLIAALSIGAIQGLT